MLSMLNSNFLLHLTFILDNKHCFTSKHSAVTKSKLTTSYLDMAKDRNHIKDYSPSSNKDDC
jgi:hypothetical protein